MRPACESISLWLSGNPQRVAVIHCKAGKGRTGTLIAAYLVHAQREMTATEAMELFGIRRTKNGKGITIPSQQRFVRYYAAQVGAMAAARHGWPNPLPQQAAPAAEADSEEKSDTSSIAVALPAMAAADGTDRSVAASAASGEASASAGSTGEAGAVAGGGSKSDARCTLVSSSMDEDDPSATLIAVSIERDTARDPGFTLAKNAAGRAAVADVTSLQVSSLIQPGDEVHTIAGHSTKGQSYHLVRVALQIAPDPLCVTFLRRHLSTTAPAAVTQTAQQESRDSSATDGVDVAASTDAGSPAAPPVTPAPSPAVSEHVVSSAAYLSRLARGIGPWAAGSDSLVLPAPRVQLLGIQLSHVPMLEKSQGKRSLWSRFFSCFSKSATATGGMPGATAAATAGKLYVQVYGGIHCRTLLWDSSTGAPPDISAWRSAATSAVDAVPEWGSKHSSRRLPTTASPAKAVGTGLSATPTVTPLPQQVDQQEEESDVDSGAEPQVSWAARSLDQRVAPATPAKPSAPASPVSLVVSEDFRVLIRACGLKKPLAAAWLHTAMLPLPSAASAAVAPQISRIQTAQAEAEEQAWGAASLATASADMQPSTLSSPASTDAVQVEEKGAQPVAAATPSASAGTAKPLLPARLVRGDFPGGAIAPGLPTLGSCYTAEGRLTRAASSRGGISAAFVAGAAGDADSIRAKLATGALRLRKHELDNAIKDKKHKRWPQELRLTLCFRALDLPEVYFQAVGATEATTA